jgi:hypothetical protein
VAGESLAPYYAGSPRYSPALGGRSGLHGQVDALINELQVPCTLDQDGDWRLHSDVGQFILMVDRIRGDLAVVQTVQVMQRRPRSYGDLLHKLLKLNFDAEGARFAAVEDQGQEIVVLTARLRPDEIDAERLERMLEQAMRLSRRLDEVLGTAAGQPGVAPAAIPPPQGSPVAPAQPVAQPAPAAQPVAMPASQPTPTPPAQPVPAPRPAAAPPADWYPDPHGQARLRYWDGQRWTEHAAQ